MAVPCTELFCHGPFTVWNSWQQSAINTEKVTVIFYIPSTGPFSMISKKLLTQNYSLCWCSLLKSERVKEMLTGFCPLLTYNFSAAALAPCPGIIGWGNKLIKYEGFTMGQMLWEYDWCSLIHYIFVYEIVL